MEIRVPRLGEGAESGSVINILVKEGDKIAKDQTILELENEKAVAPIPSSEAGTVTKVFVSVGDQVSVGQPIISLSPEGGEAPSEGEKEKAPARPQPAPQQQAPPAPAAQTPAPGAGYTPYQYRPQSGFAPPAAPSVRKLAQELGIDLTRVRGSERGGRIVMSDLRAYINYLQGVAFAGQPPAGPQAPKAPAESIDFSKWGSVTKKPLSSLRKKIGEKMQESWTTIPHVTQNDEVDVTDLMQLAKKAAPDYEKHGARLTLTAVILKACVTALKKYPVFNASLDEAAGELVFKEYYHIGVAVDTEQGLIVPVLRDADKKSLLQISKELAELAEKTRQRKIAVEDLKGGTFTVSNLGGIGGSHFAPIINKPEVAILGVSRGILKPVVRNKKIEQRIVMPVSVSYDHRVIDGADGARFIRAVAQALEELKEEDLALEVRRSVSKSGPKAKASNKSAKKAKKTLAKGKK